MVNSKRIVEKMKEKNLNKEMVCAGLGISISSFNNKLHCRTSFTVQEARDLSAILAFTDKEMLSVFFGIGSQNVNKGVKNG